MVRNRPLEPSLEWNPLQGLISIQQALFRYLEDAAPLESVREGG